MVLPTLSPLLLEKSAGTAELLTVIPSLMPTNHVDGPDLLCYVCCSGNEETEALNSVQGSQNLKLGWPDS